MKILFAADGSQFTKKALAFLVTHEGLSGPDGELVVLNVQTPVPPRVKSMLGAAEVAGYHHDESEKVLAPIRKFLDKHALSYRCITVVGAVSEEIVKATTRQKAHMLVMGSRGHGLFERALMGSVAQRVLADCKIPVLLVQ